MFRRSFEYILTPSDEKGRVSRLPRFYEIRIGPQGNRRDNWPANWPNNRSIISKFLAKFLLDTFRRLDAYLYAGGERFELDQTTCRFDPHDPKLGTST